jgi:hypothetical protein
MAIDQIWQPLNPSEQDLILKKNELQTKADDRRPVH